MTNETSSIVHAAGILDVRGSIYLSRVSQDLNKYPIVRLVVTDKKKYPVLEEPKRLFEGCISNYSGGRKGWTVQCRKASQFLYVVRYFMVNKEKKKLADFVAEKYGRIPTKVFNRRFTKMMERYKNI